MPFRALLGMTVSWQIRNPRAMGYEGIEAVAVLNGEDLGGKVVDTGVSVLTK